MLIEISDELVYNRLPHIGVKSVVMDFNTVFGGTVCYIPESDKSSELPVCKQMIFPFVTMLTDTSLC